VKRTKVAAGLQKPSHYMGVEDPIAKHLGIVVKEEALPLNDEGQYIPANPPVIVINPGDSASDRLNFTFFHEISHHLICKDDELYSFIHEYASNDDKHFGIALEHYCDIGAAEFLIPSEEVRRVIDEQGFSIKLIEPLESVYPASKPAIAIQLAQCATHECFVVVCEWGAIPQRQTSQASFVPFMKNSLLYILYSSRSSSAKYSIGRFTPIPDDHVIASAYRNKGMVKDIAPILFKNGNRNWECECEAFYYKGRVYATFNATSPVSPEQMHLF